MCACILMENKNRINSGRLSSDTFVLKINIAALLWLGSMKNAFEACEAVKAKTINVQSEGYSENVKSIFARNLKKQFSSRFSSSFPWHAPKCLVINSNGAK